MKKTYIVLGSITYALKAQDLLERYGIRSTIKRNREYNQTIGCGYSLELTRNVDQAISIIENSKIKIRTIIREGV